MTEIDEEALVKALARVSELPVLERALDELMDEALVQACEDVIAVVGRGAWRRIGEAYGSSGSNVHQRYTGARRRIEDQHRSKHHP